MHRSPVFRGVARVAAMVLLLAGPLGFQHAGSDDALCLPAAGSPDGPSLSSSPADPPEHCPVCHWTRSLRSPFATAVHVEYAAVATDEVSPPRPAALRAPALDRFPARAPPASF